MSREEKLAELRILTAEADVIRRELGFSRPGTVTFLAQRDRVEEETVVVEADGFGGATTSVVVGNYPIDFSVKFEKFFPSEEEAETAGEQIAFEGASPRGTLGAPRRQTILSS